MNREELTKLLKNENIQHVLLREIWIWGTGHTALLYQEGFKRMDRISIAGYCDNDSTKWGKTLGGKPIVSPEQLKNHENVCVLICSPQQKIVNEVGMQLTKMEIDWYRIDEVIFSIYKDKVIKCYDLLEDIVSKEVYSHIIQCRINCTVPEKKHISNKQYFILDKYGGHGNEVYVDCGAFTGDTIERFIWEKSCIFKKIIAFESDSGNYNAMKYRVERLKKEWNLNDNRITLHHKAVGNINSNIKFHENGNPGSIIMNDESDIDNSVGIEIVSLDRVIEEPYTFLKADIEGYEYNMLEGAKNGIRCYKPTIAICIYHNAIDFFSILLLLHELVPEYKFMIRHHSITLSETVLYAYI